ncbi:MAG: ferrous iron transport protein A [Haliscomenobacter sp.]
MVAPWKSGIPLTDAAAGKSGFVSHFTNERMACKFMAMGVLPGAVVKIVRQAPFGGGCYIKADKLLLALRREEAASIVLR